MYLKSYHLKNCVITEQIGTLRPGYQSTITCFLLGFDVMIVPYY